MSCGSNVVLIRRPVSAGKPVLFLDRDGVINIDTGYVSDPEGVTLCDGAAEMIAAFNAASWPVIVVSNQSGLGRGYFDQITMLAVQARIEQLLAQKAAYLDAVLLCGASPEEESDLSAWRKPEPGMLLTAERLFDVDLTRSILVGDKVSDMQAAAAAGLALGLFVDTRPPSAPFPATMPVHMVHDRAKIRPGLEAFR